MYGFLTNGYTKTGAEDVVCVSEVNLLVMMSVQFFLMGLLAEMMCRTYHESQNKPTYVIRRVIEPSGGSDKGGDDG